MAKIKDIVAGRADWVVDARVIRMWVVPDSKNPQIANSVELILMDKERDCIHAHVKRSLLLRFHPILEEGKTYHIEKLMVGCNDAKYASTPHKFKVKFMLSTSCTPIESSEIPLTNFMPVPFLEVKQLAEEGCLFDVIGHLVERGDIKSYEKNGRPSSYIQFVLEDISANRLPCTFWDTYADELQTKLAEHSSSTPPILLIQLCKLKIFKGVVGISNSYFATKVFFNSHVSEIEQYRTRMATPSAPLTEAITQVVTPPQLTFAEEMLQTRRMSISDLTQATDVGVVGVVGRIVEIETQHGWVYDSCNRCLRKVRRVGSRFYCKNSKCSRIVTGVPRFKVEANVIDPTGQTTFIMINRVVSSFLGVTTQQLLETTPDDAPYPSEFHAFLDKDLLFKIEILDGNITQNWQQYAVKRMTSDPTVITSYVDKYPIRSEIASDATSFMNHDTKTKPNTSPSVDSMDSDAFADDVLSIAETTTQGPPVQHGFPIVSEGSNTPYSKGACKSSMSAEADKLICADKDAYHAGEVVNGKLPLGVSTFVNPKNPTKGPLYSDQTTAEATLASFSSESVNCAKVSDMYTDSMSEETGQVICVDEDVYHGGEVDDTNLHVAVSKFAPPNTRTKRPLHGDEATREATMGSSSTGTAKSPKLATIKIEKMP